MKTLCKMVLPLYLFLLFALPCKLSAQSKEVCEQSIAKYMNEAVGMKIDKKMTIDNYIEENTFKINEIKRIYYTKEEEARWNKDIFTENKISWASATSVEIDTTSNHFNEYYENALALININFSIKYAHYWTCTANYNLSCGSGKTEYKQELTLIVPRTRAMACKKALEHLIKLSKEEDKDPFDD